MRPEPIAQIDVDRCGGTMRTRRYNWPVLVFNILRDAKKGATYQSIYDDMGGANEEDMQEIRHIIAVLADQGVAVVRGSRIYSYRHAPK